MDEPSGKYGFTLDDNSLNLLKNVLQEAPPLPSIPFSLNPGHGVVFSYAGFLLNVYTLQRKQYNLNISVTNSKLEG